MKRRTLVAVLLTAWLVAFAGSFVAFRMAAPSEFGLTGGLNRVATFLAWQAVAAGLAVATFLASRTLPRRTGLRRVAVVPVAILGLAALVLAGLILFVNLQSPAPLPAPPDLAPAEPAPAPATS